MVSSSDTGLTSSVLERVACSMDPSEGREMTVMSPAVETPLRGLLASPPEPLPFAPSLHIRAFLLRRDAGNVLVYSAPKVDGSTFAAVGGPARAYLGHWHEAMFGEDLP